MFLITTIQPISSIDCRFPRDCGIRKYVILKIFFLWKYKRMAYRTYNELTMRYNSLLDTLYTFLLSRFIQANHELYVKYSLRNFAIFTGCLRFYHITWSDTALATNQEPRSKCIKLLINTFYKTLNYRFVEEYGSSGWAIYSWQNRHKVFKLEDVKHFKDSLCQPCLSNEYLIFDLFLYFSEEVILKYTISHH